MDATRLLEQDHRVVDDLFKEFEQAGPEAYKTKEQLVEQIITELVIHAEIEELHFYPAVRNSVAGMADELDEDLEEHHVMEVLLAELNGMKATDDRFDAKVEVLAEIVRHHVEEEEKDLFPKVRKELSTERLEELGATLEEAKETVPTRPHPWSPDTPPGNAIAGLLAAPIDRVKDAVRRNS